ncbi:MAG: hypothetical protein COA67_08625 [Lutibacter sp.]|nr:MAG: hypothetical protein COA67_08625 [Lutibacter sp.]
MKKIILLLFVSLITFFSNAQKKKTYYEGGELQSVTSYKNGKPNGTAKVYYENGKLAGIGKFSNGEMTGKYIEYFPDGKTYRINHYQNGKLDGMSIAYYENGKTEETGSYKNGKEIGYWNAYEETGELWRVLRYSGKEETLDKVYFENGNIKEKGYYDQNGEATGQWEEYYENGNLKSIYHYQNGLVIQEYREYKKFYENGKLEIESKLINATDSIYEEKSYYKSGNLYSISEHYNESLSSNFVKHFYDNSNGAIKRELYYKNKGKEIDGPIKNYYETGELQFTISDTSNSKEDYQKNYDKEGTLRSEGKRATWDYKYTGKWKYYHINGQLEWEGEYSNGKPDGEWIGYHNNGKIYITNQWEKGKLLNVIACFDGSGNQLEKGTLINGNGTVNDYDINGNLIKTESYLNGEKQE